MCIGRNLLFQSSTVHSVSSTCKPFVSLKKIERKTNPIPSLLPIRFPKKNKTKNESNLQPPIYCPFVSSKKINSKNESKTHPLIFYIM